MLRIWTRVMFALFALLRHLPAITCQNAVRFLVSYRAQYQLSNTTPKMSLSQEASSQIRSQQDLPTEYAEEGIYVALTHAHLDPLTIMNKVRSPSAGAIVLFAGTSSPHYAI